jgi:hypothetical protein
MEKSNIDLPQMALSNDGLLTRHIKKFHEWFQQSLAKHSVITLRKTAWQLNVFYEENRKYKDVEFIKSLIEILEFVIQKKGNTDWTINKAKKDLRGRFSSRYASSRKPVPINEEFRKALQERVSNTAEKDLETIRHSRTESLEFPFRIRNPSS